MTQARADVMEMQGGRPGSARRGVVLVVALMVVMLIAVLGSAYITVSGTEHQIGRNDQEVTRALDVAEAGVQTALNQLNLNPTSFPTPSDTLGPGQFTATVTAAAPPAGQRRIVAVGYVPSQAAPRAVRRIDVLVMRPTFFQYGGAFGDSSVTISSSGTTDSYDSQVAAYDPAIAGSNGDVGSNGDITLSGSSLIKGDAAAGATVSDPTHVTGTSTNGAPPVDLPDVPCPTGGYTPFVPLGPGVTYNAATGDLSISGGNNLTLPVPPTSYYFHDVTLSGGSTLTLAPGANHVDIHISAKLTASGGGLVNTSAQPTQLSIWGCGADTSAWALSGGSGAYFAVYAPNHKITVSGSGNIWGSVVGKEIVSSGGSRFHYDEALSRLRGNPNKYAVQPWSWTELLP